MHTRIKEVQDGRNGLRISETDKQRNAMKVDIHNVRGDARWNGFGRDTEYMARSTAVGTIRRRTQGLGYCMYVA
jgi:hypothetical protein